MTPSRPTPLGSEKVEGGISLAPVGGNWIHRLAEALRERGPHLDVLYGSNQKCALDLTRIFCEVLELPVKVDLWPREHCLSRLAGYTKGSEMASFADYFKEAQDDL